MPHAKLSQIEEVDYRQSDFIVLQQMETVGSWQKSLFIFENNRIKVVDSINHFIIFINSTHYFSTRKETFLFIHVHLSKIVIFTFQRCYLICGPTKYYKWLSLCPEH